MRIAVTYENNQVFQHFGRCQQFKIYELENNQIKHTYILDANGIGHGALAGLLQQEHVYALKEKIHMHRTPDVYMRL